MVYVLRFIVFLFFKIKNITSTVLHFDWKPVIIACLVSTVIILWTAQQNIWSSLLELSKTQYQLTQLSLYLLDNCHPEPDLLPQVNTGPSGFH